MRIIHLLFFLPSLLAAQSSFLNNPDIAWAAEIEQDWVVDVPSLETEWDSGITTLKLLRTDQNEAYWSSPFLAELVYHAASKGFIPVFKDPMCRQPLVWNAIYPLTDSVVVFDPETYEEKTIVVRREADPFHDFKAWRLRQILAYHKNTATWSTTVEAIAPLVVVKNDQGDSVGLRPLFWFRPDNKRPKMRSSDIVWAKQTKNRQIKTAIPSDPVKPVKVIDGFQNPLPHLIAEFEKNPKHPFYDSWDQHLLTREERNRIFAKTDTIVTIDPETYEEKLAMVRNEINLNSIHQLRLLQTWYWDERRHRLFICLDAVAPLIDVYDSMGNFRYSKPLFYQKIK